MPLLEVQDLRVTLQTARGPADALREVSFTLERGGTLGLIGESGCGKSITALALMGLLPEGAPYVDSFAWSPEESVRKLFHNQAIADRMLSQPPGDAQRAINAKNKATVAKLGQATRLHNPDLPKWLHRIHTRTLVVWGAHDNIHAPSFGQAWVDALPNARLSVIADAGHLPHAEQAPVVAQQVLAFMAE